MSWGNLLVRSNPEEKIIELYQSPAILTLDEIKRNSNGSLSVIR